MKKIFTKYLCIYMALGLICIITAIFLVQTYTSNSHNIEESKEKLQTVKEKLISNDEKIQQLTESLGQSSLAKARAFAYLIDLNPNILKDDNELQRLLDTLLVDQLFVIDENGVIINGTIKQYIGLDFHDGEQTREFLQILEDPSIEVVQEPQPNAAEEVLFQYIGVARIDSPGIVQVGIRPEVLEDMLDSTTIDKALKEFDFGETGYIFAIDLETGLISAHDNESLIGAKAIDAGFPEDILSGGEGSATVDGVNGFYVAEVYNNMVIGTMLSRQEYYKDRTNQTMVVSASLICVFIALIILINKLVNNKIVKGVHNITKGLEKITNGDLTTIINETRNPEFQILSHEINSMVMRIKENMQKNEQLLEQQQLDMEKSKELIHSVKAVCEEIDHVSKETLSISQTLHMGSNEQETAVENLNDTMKFLSEKLELSAKSSLEIAKNTNHSVQSMLQTKQNMNQLVSAMDNISDTSLEIEKIISEIDSIANQTNMLSLNASIEAARAGESGRGFAVVANQVGELAARSTEAAKKTASLISNAILAVNKGKEITQLSVEEFLSVVSQIEQAGKGVNEISDMTKEEVNVISSAMQEVNQISEVVEKNSSISENSEITSQNLANEAGKLREMVDSNI